jgi:hypothetical protein
LRVTGTLNLEGLTMPDGVLTLGGWGEGFNERRHPHTYAHELILSLTLGRPGARGSIVVGKGFAPFGTDDPMNRPALRFPVNHHWSQVLERALVIGGIQAGPVILEGGLFNGDEPEAPGQWPRIAGRFGDSWAVRVSLIPLLGVEMQASRAHVKSPEHRPGAGSAQEKWSASGRFEGRVRTATLYALAEWARTEELAGLFRFETWLAEAQWRWSRHRPYYRIERTDRPEEERLLDPFRSVRPHLENTILGVSRWTIHTAGYGFEFRSRVVQLEPLIEVSHATAAETRGGIFDVAGLFGRTSLWSLTLGVRVSLPRESHRMGRYGVAIAPTHLH